MLIREARQVVERAAIRHHERVIGVAAAADPNAPAANYEECFIRDFVPAALIWLLDGETVPVRDFLLLSLSLRDERERRGQTVVPGVMPASFKVVHHPDGSESVLADFGDRAIGRVAPVDSMMWWLFLLATYVRVSGDTDFAATPEIQQGVRQMLNLVLQNRFEVFPTLPTPDGCCMIDRRMGVDGHPLEIQALFYATLGNAIDILGPREEHQWLIERAHERRQMLAGYIRGFYWLDLPRLNQIHRFKTELFGEDIDNFLNLYPESVPDWVVDWLPDETGYFVGNLSPGRMDFRYFALGNLLTVLFGLATPAQSRQVLRLYESRWDDLVGLAPAKIVFPAVDGIEWRLLTGCDPKNPAWSYHNGGNWPVLLWPLVAASVLHGTPAIGQRALQLALDRFPRDHWPEYYDGRHGRLIGRRANTYQTWTAAALVLAWRFLHEPEALDRLGLHAGIR